MASISSLATVYSQDPASTASLRAGEARALHTKQTRKASGEQIDKVAEDFEGVFISQMLSSMFEGVKTDEVFGGGEAEDIYRSMMLNEYGKLMSRTGGLGLADHVKREMLRMQEVE